jgi:hypothetical protein
MSFVINPYVLGAGAGGGGGGEPPATFDPDTDTLTDTINLDTPIVEFLYAGAGEIPAGAEVDEIALDVDIVDFSYTT